MTLRLLAAAALAVLLTGCASFTPDGGMAPVLSAASLDLRQETLKIDSPEKAAAAQARVRDLLAKPLDPDGAVRVALLNNRNLQAEYNALGIAEADYVASTLPESPTVTFERVTAAGILDIERRLIADLLSLATLPARREIGEKRFEAARFRAIEATFRTAAETRRAWYRAVAATQAVSFLEQARLSAEAAAELTTKLGEAGSSSKLDQARAAAFHAEISNDLARARLRAVTEREALTRRLGLWGADTGYRLPTRLPPLPKAVETSTELEARAVLHRVDLTADRLELAALARSLGLTEATRFVSAVELAGISATEWEKDGPDTHRTRRRGFELEATIPIFDLGETSVRRARETYMQAVNRLAAKAVEVRSEARAGYAAYRASYDIARAYQTRILPLRRIVGEQAVLEYNGMLKDVFTLLTTARESAASNLAAIEAKRDFFIAAVDFQSALIGGGAGSGSPAAPSAAPAEAGGEGH
ncbi:TolC family protein [Prosthecomicrobium sp. N25]|uniref:TolC family protein n=1 Tax=Prosthecomicrobium sp. N25 TaxID=3129254 RepID=UPI0030787FC6